jgi:hypothetical protein
MQKARQQRALSSAVFKPSALGLARHNLDRDKLGLRQRHSAYSLDKGKQRIQTTAYELGHDPSWISPVIDEASIRFCKWEINIFRADLTIS